MREILTTEAEGHVLCHDITRIIQGGPKGVAFPKGHVVTKGDIPVLLSLGKEHLYVFEPAPGMLHENEAAEILYGLCAGEHMKGSPVREGKIEVIAEQDGLFRVDTERLRALNSLGGMMAATRRGNCPVQKGDRLAGTRVIPLMIEKEKMDEAKALVGDEPILSLHPYRPKKVAFVITGSEVEKGLVEDGFTPVLREKLAPYGAEEIGRVVLGDEPEAVTEAIRNFLRQGAELVLCTGGMSVDPDDKTPLAIKNATAQVVSYGSPVLPGAMFLLAYTESGKPVMGLPGGVMHARRSVFDLMLPRVMADVPVTAEDLAALGYGGLCLNCETCIFPRCAFGAGV